jgi:hypothetical protein
MMGAIAKEIPEAGRIVVFEAHAKRVVASAATGDVASARAAKGVELGGDCCLRCRR